MKKIIKPLLSLMYRNGIPFLLNRGEIPSILNAKGLIGEGAEVGVKHGQFSEFILDHWDGKLLYSIDPWREFTTEVYHDDDNVNQKEQERNYQITANRLARFGDRAKLLRMTSEEATNVIKDGTLDFVYLDARHDYDSVVEDIALWYPKVKSGGVMAGHDYFEGMIGGTKFGVKPAVDEFVARYNLNLKVTMREPVYKSWLIVKP
jgi:Methyltransferase domain